MLSDLPALNEAPRVFVYDSAKEAPFTAGRSAMPSALIEAAGRHNIMDEFDKSWATGGWEAVVDRNPEVVVIINYGDVTAEQKRAFMRENATFADVDAVKNDRFVVIDYISAVPALATWVQSRPLLPGSAHHDRSGQPTLCPPRHRAAVPGGVWADRACPVDLGDGQRWSWASTRSGA